MQFDFSIRCRHCEVETVEPVQATVTGSIPSYALGDYIFNSAGIGRYGDAEYSYLFDFGSVIQKVRVSSLGCSYMSRYLQSSTFAKNQKAGTIAVCELGTSAVAPPKKSGLVGRLLQMVDYSSLFSDNTTSSVTEHNGKLYALGDKGVWWELDPDDLSVIKKETWLTQGLGLANASPHCVPLSSGNLLTVGLSITASGSKYNIVEFPRSGGSPQILGKITPRWSYSSSTIHSFGASLNYLVIVELPMSIRYVEIIKCVMKSGSFLDVIKWLPEELVKIMIVDKKTWKQHRKFTMKTQYVTHILNCCETDDGDLIIDFESYKGPEIIQGLNIKNLKNPNLRGETMDTGFTGSLIRAILPLSSSDPSSEAMVECISLIDVPLQCPVINPNYFTRRYKFAYGTSPTEHDHSRATKVNVETGEVVHFMQPGLYMTEANYIPNPKEEAEDDGTVAIFCLSSKSSSYGCLLFLSAADMTEIARVEFTAADAVPWTNHGHFSPASS